MIELAFVLSVFFVCAAYLIGINLRQAHRLETRKHLNTVQLASHLEARIKSMDELKERMEALLLKNGFGRK